MVICIIFIACDDILRKRKRGCNSLVHILVNLEKIIFRTFYVFFIFHECHWKPEWAHDLSICGILHVILKIGLFQLSTCDGTPFRASPCVLYEIVVNPKKHFYYATLPKIGSALNSVLFVFMKIFFRTPETVPYRVIIQCVSKSAGCKWVGDIAYCWLVLWCFGSSSIIYWRVKYLTKLDWQNWIFFTSGLSETYFLDLN